MSDSVFLSVRAIPNKPESRIVGTSDDGMTRIEVKSQPIEGKANQELINFLAKLLGVNKNQVIIVRGLNSRNKLIKIESIKNSRFLDILRINRS